MTEQSRKSTDESNKNGVGPKPLAQKTDAELKRETKARLKHLDPITATELVNEVVSKQVTGSVSGFVNFLRQNGITGVAIGFVVGTQVQGVVKEFITSFINPLSQLLFGKEEINKLSVYVDLGHGHAASFVWGDVVFTLIDFILILLVIYMVIKLFRLDKLDIPKK